MKLFGRLQDIHLRINYFGAALTFLIFVTSFHLRHDAKQFQKYELLPTAHTI